MIVEPRPNWGACLLMALLVSGCAGTETASQSIEQSPIKKLALLYGQFIGRNKGQPPKDEADLKAYYAGKGKSTLDYYKLTSLDELLTSPRDGKPYVILYGPAKGPPGPAGQPVVIYEQVGVGGKRYVASSLAAEEVDEATFKKYVP